MKAIKAWVGAIPSGLLTMLVVVVGAGALYGLGRWDSGVNARLEAWQDAVDAVLAQHKAFAAREDSLQTVADSAVARASRDSTAAAGSRRQLLAARQRAVERRVEIGTQDLNELASGLRLVPIAINQWAADSNAVRFLAGVQADATSALEQVTLLEQENVALTSQTVNLGTALRAAQSRGDTALTRVTALEELLQEGRDLSECKILFFFPCPSRGVAFVAGGVTASVIVIAVRK